MERRLVLREDKTENNIIDSYFDQQEKIYKHFGLYGKHPILPLEDRREFHWYINQDEDIIFGGKCDIINDTDDYYQEEIIPKSTYRGKDVTLVIIDEDLYASNFVAIYDNSKEISEDDINGE